MGLLILLGTIAGALTTVAGLGGGMMLVLVLSLLRSPPQALAITAPALLLGNAHRLWLFRHAVHRKVALSFCIPAAPAAFAGGILAVALPDAVLHWLLLAMTVFAIASKIRGWKLPAGPMAIAPVGAAAGVLTATTGGGGLLAAPALLGAGLRAEAYVATGAAGAIAMHIGRIAAYGLGGLVDRHSLTASAVLAVSIIGGNLLGRTLRARLGEQHSMRIAWGTLVVAIALAVAGVR